MKSALRLLGLGSLLVGLCAIPLRAYDYTLSGYYPGAQQQWSVSTPSSTSVSGSIYVVPPAGDYAMGAIILQDTTTGAYAYSLMTGGPGTQSKSSSQSGISAGNYTLQETFYDLSNASRWLQGNISATITW